MRRSRPEEIRIRASEEGFAAEGRGFYVWDQDRQVVLETARELQRGNFSGSSAQRVLLVRGSATPPGKADPEALDA